MVSIRKIIIVSALLLLGVGLYFGRGLLPADQIKQDILLQYVGSIYETQARLGEALRHYENGDQASFSSQLVLASQYARHSSLLVSEWFIGENFETPTIMGWYNADIINLAGLASRNEITEQDIDTLRELNNELTKLIDNIGTVAELSDSYTPSSELLDKIISGFEETYDSK